jgi:uncharacterized radical SAM protein YgiQ
MLEFEADAESRLFRHLPMSGREMEWRGWDQLDVILISGDAFIDHPAFEIAIIGRVLETMGLRIGHIAQPDWRSSAELNELGPPRLFYVVSAGKNDSMIANNSPTRRPRKIDFFSPGRLPGLRPDRASLVYAQWCKNQYPDAPVVITGIEATGRKLAHYDYWDEGLRRGLLAESPAEWLAYGPGERAVTHLAQVIARGGSPAECRQVRGLVYKLAGQEATEAEKLLPPDFVELPSYQELQLSKQAFVDAFRLEHANGDYHRAPKALVQRYDDCVLVQTPPQRPLTTVEMDRIYALPYSRTPHPRYRGAGPIPSFETVKFSLTTHRGCFGDCSACNLRQHEGRHISSRSRESILKEATLISDFRYFRGWISNIGGPSANLYGQGCGLDVYDKTGCDRDSCLLPTRCPNLLGDCRDYVELLRAVQAVDGVERCYLASHLRIDVIENDPFADELVEEIVRHFLSGHLKMPFDHVSAEVNRRLRKYDLPLIEKFIDRFERIRARFGLDDVTITPYFTSGHPGSRLENAIEIAMFMKRRRLSVCQIQDFVPLPGTASAAMYYTGIDPFNNEPVYRPLSYRERKLQRSLFQFYKPQNERYVFEALKEANRLDLVGSDEFCLLSSEPKWMPFD